MKRFYRCLITCLLTGLLTISIAACGTGEQLPEGESFGANPTLPAPDTSLIPTVRIAPAKGWLDGEAPKAAEGFAVKAFATGLDHPRWLYVLPNGDVPERYKGGAFIGQHGSWNRVPRSGYKVIFVPFADGKPAGKPEDVLSGFLNDDGDAQGRPVGVVVDSKGALLVADDVGNSIWRITPSNTQSSAAQ